MPHPEVLTLGFCAHEPDVPNEDDMVTEPWPGEKSFLTKMKALIKEKDRAADLRKRLPIVKRERKRLMRRRLKVWRKHSSEATRKRLMRRRLKLWRKHSSEAAC